MRVSRPTLYNQFSRSRDHARSTHLATGALALGLIASGCGGSGDGGSSGSSDAATGGQSPPPVKLYFTRGEQFDTVERDLPATGKNIVPATRALLNGPTGREAAGSEEAQTQIPDGVKVRKVKVSGDGQATVELSDRFLDGIPSEKSKRTEAEDAALNARAGQVVYTLTQFRRVSSVKVKAGGITVDPSAEQRSDFGRPEQGPKPVRKPRGSAVPGTRQIQTGLAGLGYLPSSAVDGLDGYRTQQAVIAFQAWEGLDRDGVVGPATTAALAAARRPQPSGKKPGRRVEVYREKGVALLIRNGRTRRAIHVSTGAGANATPSGRYAVFRKELRSWSVPFSTWLPFASYFNQGIAFHEYPDVPAYSASHGCVRVPAPEAPGVYAFAKISTVVLVF